MMRPTLTTEKTKAYGRWVAVLTDGERRVEGWDISESTAIYRAYLLWNEQTQTAPASGN